MLTESIRSHVDRIQTYVSRLLGKRDSVARIAIVTMKTQLRGRIRREVTTLLEDGHELLVIGLISDSDFLQGLDHPRLQVVLLPPSSIYTRGVARLRSVVSRTKTSRPPPFNA